MINMPYIYCTFNFIADLRQLTQNKKIPYGTVDKKTLADITEKNLLYYEDMKLPSVSFYKESELDTSELVYNYSRLYAAVMSNNNVIRFYIDMGLIPFAFYPTSHRSFIEDIDEILNKTGLHHFRRTAVYNHNRKSIYKHMSDSWVSRMDAAEFLGCKPENVRSSELYKKVMNNESY